MNNDAVSNNFGYIVINEAYTSHFIHFPLKLSICKYLFCVWNDTAAINFPGVAHIEVTVLMQMANSLV